MISVIPIEEGERWDRWVRSFPEYDVCYLSGYAAAFQLHGEGEPQLITFDDGSTRAMNVVMRRDIAQCPHFSGRLPEGEWFDLSTPYGYGGFWFDGPNTAAVEEAYQDYLHTQGIVSEFVRFHLFGQAHRTFPGEVESRTQNVVRTLDLSWDEICRDFEHKVRKNLKKAERSGLRVEFDFAGQRLPEFLAIYHSTMERNQASDIYHFSEAFFRQLKELDGHILYVHVIHQEKVISSELLLYGTENCHSFLGGTEADYYSLRPNDLLKCEVIRWAQRAGLKRFILGGGYGQDDGIFRYKKSFAPHGLHKFYLGKRIVDQQKYQDLLELRAQLPGYDPDSRYFPKYRG